MVNWSTLPNNGTNGENSLSLQDIEDEFGGDGDDIELGFYYNGGAYVPDVAWNYAIPNLYNNTGNFKDPLDPLSFNAFYGAVWGTFVNFAMAGGGGGGGAGSSAGRGSNNIGNGSAGGTSTVSMDTNSGFGGTAAGGAGGLHGDSANFEGTAGGGSIFGTGGPATPENTNGSNGAGGGAAGAGGGGDRDSGKGDNIGYGGTGGTGGATLEGGSPFPPDINNNRYKYNSVINFSAGNAGGGGSGSFSTGGNGVRGRLAITYDGDTYYLGGSGEHVVGSLAEIDDVP
jgi:hypothetical protein